jgi:hypothetical protein
MIASEAILLGFKETRHRPWTRGATFITKSFANKWLDLFEKRGDTLTYLATIPL